MAKKTKTDGEFNKAAWTRAAIIAQPSITLEELQSKFDSENLPKEARPENKQILAQAKRHICNRWGVSDVADLPRNNDGTINVSGMVRLYIDKFGFEHTESVALPYFSEDGIQLRTNQFASVKNIYAKNGGKQTVEPDSPDQNQDSGPRAGTKVVKQRRSKRKLGRPFGSKNKNKLPKSPEQENASLATYESFETRLDSMIQQAAALKNSKLVADLRQAQRRASAAILQHQE